MIACKRLVLSLLLSAEELDGVCKVKIKGIQRKKKFKVKVTSVELISDY
jgi:hypothetical protein